MFLGAHTLDETRDLLAVADYRFKETGKAYDALATKPADLTSDWIALQGKWSVARKEISTTLTYEAVRKFPTPASLIRTEDEYKRILNFIELQEQDPKSLQGITRRIEKLRGAAILYPNQPKPGSTTDIDLALFQDLDKAIKAGEQGAAQAKQQAEKTADSKWPWIIGGTAAATVVGMVAIKHYLGK